MDEELHRLQERQVAALEWIAASLERLANVFENVHGKPADVLMTRGQRLTQRITPTDIARGRIRIPREAKPLFPITRARIEIDLLGRRRSAGWDPRLGPDRERSGVIGIGRELMTNARAGERLVVTRDETGLVRLGR